MSAQKDILSMTLSYCLRQSNSLSSAPGPIMRIFEPTRESTPKVFSSCSSSIARSAGLSATIEPSGRFTLFAVIVGTSFSFIEDSEPTSRPSFFAVSPICNCFSISCWEIFLEWFMGHTPSTANNPQFLKYCISLMGSFPAVGVPKENPRRGENFILNFLKSAPKECAENKAAPAATENVLIKSRLCIL